MVHALKHSWSCRQTKTRYLETIGTISRLLCDEGLIQGPRSNFDIGGGGGGGTISDSILGEGGGAKNTFSY